MKIPVLGYAHDSIVDGDGVREVVFVAGCPFKCKGCHNPESWNAKNGTLTDIDEIYKELTSNPLATGITLSGGEPSLYAKEFLPLVKKIKEQTDLDIWMWTGSKHEILKRNKINVELLKYIDVLVDGRFVLELRDITENNMYRGSLNQRVLKLENGEIVEELYPNGYSENNG